MKIFLVSIFTLFAASCLSSQSDAQPTYTNKQASDCFTERAVSACQAPIKKCTDDPQCKEELAKFQSCSFGLSEVDIFNGFCFRKWKQSALLTKEMIDCLVQTCNLEYNSVISVENLYRCSQDTVIKNYLQCDDRCGEELQKIRNGFNKFPLQQLFNQDINDESARKIVELIKFNCIQNQFKEQSQETPKQQQDTQEQSTQQQSQQQSSSSEQEQTSTGQVKTETTTQPQEIPQQQNEPQEEL